ncbi:uncharacterized protein LOC135494673 [Lineus longissimus]|uniref:uncharacterized protein LOC135494673 n=1 Tax=Lineus longissimus TaxID=88925 RepID=UPI00315C576D
MGDYLVHLSWILYVFVFNAVRQATPEVVLVQLSSEATKGGAVYKGALIPNGLTVESTPLKETRNVRELVYDSQDEQVYWIDAEKRTINAAFTDGSNFRILYTLSPDSVPNCLSLDPSARLLYYADSGENVIGVINVEGSYHHTLFYDLDEPSHLAVDTKNGFIYWVMAGSTPGIYKGPTCGTRKDAIVTENVPQISGLALDTRGNKLFWSDGSTGKLEESGPDGTGRRVLWEDPSLSPMGLAVGEDGLYFVEKTTRHLYRFRSQSSGRLRKREAGQENVTEAEGPERPVEKEVAQPKTATGTSVEKPTELPVDEKPAGSREGEKIPAPASKAVKEEGIPGNDYGGSGSGSAEETAADPEKPQQESVPDGPAPPQDVTAGTKPVEEIPRLQAPELKAKPEAKTMLLTTPIASTTPLPPLLKVKVMGMEQQTMMNIWPSIVRGEPGPCSVDNGQCSHICFPHPVKGHMCACPDGMVMDAEKKVCSYEAKYDPKKTYLVFTQTSRGESERGSLCTMELTSGDINCRRPSPTTFGPIEFNSEGSKAYWVDETKKAVMSSKYDGKWPRTLFKTEQASSITDLKVNGITQLMYLTDSGKNEIIEADMTHPYAERIIKTNLEEPQSIFVGKDLYWSEWGKVPKILKAALSPGRLGISEVVLETDLAQPMSLQIDYSDMSLYWVDSATSKIETLSLRTKARTTIYHDPKARLRSLALDDAYLYVLDWNSGFIKRIEKDGNHKMVKIGKAVLGQLTHLLLYRHTVYDKEAGHGECGELTPGAASKPDCYRQGTLMYCRAGCKEGFEHLPSRVQDHQKLYICMEGKWSPTEPLPQCFETIKGKGASVRGKLTFTTSKANCSDSGYRATMGEKARMIMLSNHYKMCSVSKCILKDPKVMCVPTGDTEEGEGPAKITVDVIWRVMMGPNDTVAELKEHLSKEMYHLVRTHMSVVVNDVTVPVNLGETFFERPAAACETGEEMTFEGCVACQKGSFFDQYSAECSKCPVHTFQDKPAKQKCKSCPGGTFGNITGAHNQSQCLDVDLSAANDVPLGVFPNDVNMTSSSRANRQGDNVSATHLIIGTVLCIVFFLIFIIILIILIRKRRRRTKQEAREKWAGDQIRRSLSDILKSSQLENGDAPNHEEDSPRSERHHDLDDVSIAPLAEEEDTFLGASTPNLLV